jgi:hypothetical protein
MDYPSADLQTNTAIGQEQLLLFQQEVVMTHKSDEELLDSEKALIKDAIKKCPELIVLVNHWKNAVDEMFKNAEIARSTENKIRDIIKEIYHKSFPNRKQYHGVIDVVRDVFHEEILGWKLLANGKHDPKIWDVYPMTGERKGPTKFNPEFETQGKQINELITRVQSSLNKASKSAITKKSELSEATIGPQSSNLFQDYSGMNSHWYDFSPSYVYAVDHKLLSSSSSSLEVTL